METESNIWTVTTENTFSPINKYTITLNKEDKVMGELDFNGDKLKFEGDVEESAKVFFDFLLSTFNQRIEEIKKESYKEGYSDAEWHNQAP
jgi:hypothetical protein